MCAVSLDLRSLPPPLDTDTNALLTNHTLQPDEVIAKLHQPWDPTGNNDVARTLTEEHPQDREKPLGTPRRLFDRSGWVSMPDRIVSTAQNVVVRDVERMREGLAKSYGVDHPENSLRYVVWAGMGGSAEIGKVIADALEPMAPPHHVRVFIVDSTDWHALAGVLDAITHAETALNAPGSSTLELLRHGLQRSLVLGVSMGMTSEEPVINMTALEKVFRAVGIPDHALGAHFWAMTLENSTLHEFLKVKGWGSQRLPIQLDGEDRSTLSGRNSYNSRVGLLHLAFRQQPVTPFLRAQSSPFFSDTDRVLAIRLAAALVAAEARGRSQPTLLLPPSLLPAAFWLRQQSEESLGKNRNHLHKLHVPQEPCDWVQRNLQHRIFIAVCVEGEPASPHTPSIAALQEAGHPVIILCLAHHDGAMGSLPTLLHFWVHVVLGIGLAWGNDTVGQYFVEYYKEVVQRFVLEALEHGNYGKFTIEEINTPHVTRIKQEWLTRVGLHKNAALTNTSLWNQLVGPSVSPTAEFKGATLYYAGALSHSPSSSVRVSRKTLDNAIRMCTTREDEYLDRANAALVFAGWVHASLAAAPTSYAEVTLFADTQHSARGIAWGQAWEREANSLFANHLLTSVVEGPRDNHSRLEMSTAARNEGLIVLVTESLECEDDEESEWLPRLLASSYPRDYLAMQALATYRSYLDHGRRVVLLTSKDLGVQWVSEFARSVRNALVRCGRTEQTPI